MKNYLKVDDKNKLLIMDRTFDRNRRIVGSNEYNLLQRAKADNPQYSVVLKRIKTNPEKRIYKHLTYEYMREFISRHPNAEARGKELDEMILRAKCHMTTYPKVKSWFLAAYPEIDDFTPEDYKQECEQTAVANQFEIFSEGMTDDAA